MVHEGREEKEAFKSFFGWNGPERMLSKLPAKMEEDRLLQQSLRLILRSEAVGKVVRRCCHALRVGIFGRQCPGTNPVTCLQSENGRTKRLPRGWSEGNRR